MKEDLLGLLDQLHLEFEYMDKHPEDFPVKSSFLLGSPGMYMNVLCGRLSDWTTGSKTVYVNEFDGTLDARITIKHPDMKGLVHLDGRYITIFRSALVAAYSIWRAGAINDQICLVGGGKINLMTAYLLYLLGARRFAYVGSRWDNRKNVYAFEDLCNVEFKTSDEQIANSGVVVTCTNNCDTDNLFTIDRAPLAWLTVSQDNGYTLHPDWYVNSWRFSDYPSQLSNKFVEEFPYAPHQFPFMEITGLGDNSKSQNITNVFLYGTALADLVVSKLALSEAEWYNKIRVLYASPSASLKH